MITETDVKNWLKENNKSLFYLWAAQDSLAEDMNLQDLGKLFAEPNEQIAKDWINAKTILNVKQRDDFDEDKDGSGYDLISMDGSFKIQSKLRAKDLHLEQTRRHSKKNINSGGTGAIVYSVGEADVFMFSRPEIDDYLNIDKWTYIVIPESELIDPNNPKYLRPRVNKSLWARYIGRAKEVLETEYGNRK